MRRAFVVTLSAGAWLVLFGLGSRAGAAELEDYLERAEAAQFTGRQIVVTYWDASESAAGMYTVAQAGGMAMADSGRRVAMVGDGKLEAGTGSGVDHMLIAEAAEWRLSERYVMGDPQPTIRLGREATAVAVLENGQKRMRLVFDNATGAALLSEVFDGDGELYRIAVMLEFSAVVSRSRLDPGPLSDYEIVPRAAPLSLPDSAAGYWRADTYRGPNAIIHAFYTDGLFSFSVFEFAGGAEEGDFVDAPRLESDGFRYLRVMDPGSLRLFWDAADASYVLVGDLPPDHLEQVLADLPRPGRANVLVRVWRGLFG